MRTGGLLVVEASTLHITVMRDTDS